MQAQVVTNSKLLVGYDDRFLVIILWIGLSMAFSLPHVFIKMLLKLKCRRFKKKKIGKNILWS